MQQSNKIVIIGASTGGVSVAARLRRLDERAEIILLDRSDVISYATCAIPYYLGGVIKDESRLQINSREEFSKLLNIDVRTHAEVFSINRQNKAVIVRDLDSGKVYEETYQKLVLAPGSIANKCTFEGRSSDHIFTIRNRDDAVDVKRFLDNTDCKRALVVGAGINALEAAENLHRLGITITILEQSNQLLSEWDSEMAALIQRRLWDKKIRVILNDQIAAVNKQDVKLASGKNLNADIIILATGVSPNVLLAQECGLAVGLRGGISVNSGMQTADDNIYALGDAAELESARTDIGSRIPFAGAAYKQGRVVAENLCGKHVSYEDPSRNIIVKVFDMTAALAGASESQLIQNKINYYKSYSESQSLARYYPNARSMIIKLLFASNTGCIMGAQIVGGTGVDKRIDIIATAMQMGQSVDCLKDLNLCFAPPFSGVRDPVNVAGMVASNMRKGVYQVLHWSDFEQINLDTVSLIDVRSVQEYEQRSIEGAMNIPLEDLRNRLADVPKDKMAIVFCNFGKKGYYAHNTLRQFGVSDVYNVSGGLTVFQSNKLSLTTSKSTNHAKAETATNKTKSSSKKSSTTKAIPAQAELNMDDVPLMENPIFSDILSEVSNSRDLLVVDPAQSEPPSLQDGIPALEFEHVTESTPLELDSSNLPVVSKVVEAADTSSDVSIIEVDASGLNCPGPIMKLAKTMSKANAGDIVRITATDSGFGVDVKTWCEKKGHRLLEFKNTRAKISALLLKC